MEWKIHCFGKVGIFFLHDGLKIFDDARFLHQIHAQTSDKIVLISNYTQTLDLFEKMCRSKK